MRLQINQRGFSLTELMVSVALGIILTAGVIEIYSGSKQTYRTQEALARLQENARFAIDMLSRDIRNSGFIGCSRIGDTSVQGQVLTGLNYDADMAVWGRQSTGSSPGTLSGGYTIGAFATPIEGNRYPDTDIIVVQGAGSCSTDIGASMGAATDNVVIAANSCGINQTDYVLISNCGSADVFQVTTDPTTGQLGHASALSTAYLDDDFTEVFPFFSNTYFVGTDTNGSPALFVADNTNATISPVAIVEGVESMQLQYGIDSDGDGLANHYLNAVDVGSDWNEVSAIRITLLLRTIEEIGAQPPGTLTLGGDNIAFTTGGPIRQQFVSTIQLRNRG